MNAVDFVMPRIDELRADNGFFAEEGPPLPDVIHFRCPVCREIAWRIQESGEQRRIPDLSVHKEQCEVRQYLEPVHV